VTLHGGDMQCRADGQRRILQHELLRSLDGIAIDRQNLIDGPEQGIECGLNAAASFDRRVAVKDFDEYFGVRDEPHPLRDERLESTLGVDLVGVGSADQIHGDVGVDENHGSALARRPQ